MLEVNRKRQFLVEKREFLRKVKEQEIGNYDVCSHSVSALVK